MMQNRVGLGSRERGKEEEAAYVSSSRWHVFVFQIPCRGAKRVRDHVCLLARCAKARTAAGNCKQPISSRDS